MCRVLPEAGSAPGANRGNRLWLTAVEVSRGSNLPQYFSGVERVDTARAIVLFLKAQVCHVNLALEF
jgi:hypothetical protein